ncbi:MAG: hypothetical protein IJZ20_03830, partial [Clostridia bacterium]|nr:hypothetical protein [Clostridia bacterium]
IRKVFTTNTGDDHSTADVELTETQLDRIGHMYPENRSRIRRLHLEKSEEESFVVTTDMLEPVRTYDMASGGAQFWNAEFGVTGFSRENGVISGEGTGGDYAVNSLAPKFKTLLASEAPYLHIRMKVSEKKDFEIFFMTNTALSWSGTRRVGVFHKAAGEFVDYYIDMTVNSAWKDEIVGIRIDPLTAAGTFEISLIEFMNYKPVEDTTPKVSVNGTELSFSFYPSLTNDGDYAVTAQPGKGLFSTLRLYYEYHRAEDGNVITIKTFDEHTYVLKIGSDKVIVDGVEKNLGYTLTLRDGLPVIHLKKLCDMLGYKYGINGNTLEIQSCSDEEYSKIMARTENSWEFDFPGKTEGFITQNGSIDVDGDGKMVFVPTGSDVAVFKLVNFKADDYTHITMGIEYSDALIDQTPQLFFTTALNPTYGWTADNCINGVYDLEGKKSGDIVEVVFDLSLNSKFDGTITGLRFDPIGGKAVFKLDYIRCIYFETDIATKLLESECASWEFESGTQMWLGQSCEVSASGGYLNGVCKAADIGIVNPTVSFNSADAQIVVMGVKYNPDFCGGTADLFFTTDKSPSYSADKCITARYREPV